MRITLYFKLINNFKSTIKLIFNKKNIDFQNFVKSTKIDDLTLRKSSFFTYYICYRCMQHFISKNIFYKHLLYCSRCIKQ